jgi:hypothetical protein
MNERARLGLRERIAITFSAAIVLGSAVYWVLQILDVIATLKMAYGL